MNKNYLRDENNIKNSLKGKSEYTIVEWSDSYGWCLFMIAGFDKQRAEEELRKLQKQYPEKKLKIEESDASDNWWHYGTD